MEYRSMKVYEVTYNNLDKIRTLIRLKHGVSINKSQALNMAVDQLIRILASKNKQTDDETK